MFYLAIQIALLLTLAALAGLAVGWWLRQKVSTPPTFGKESEENPFDARLRLEQCHRDNASLRRELKEAEERAEKLSARLENSSQQESDLLERLETYEVRLQALMEDLQMRDDTIAVLEHELEDLRRQVNKDS